MSPILNSTMAKRLLRPATSLVDQRVQRPVSRLRKELDGLRRELEEMRGQEYAVGLLFDRAGRGGSRLPTAAQIDTLVVEVAAVSGADAGVVRRNVTIAFRNVVALEALAVGRLAGSVQDVCGKLAAIPLLDPPGAQVLEVGTLYGLFSATLLRMLQRAGFEPELTVVDPLVGTQIHPGGLDALDPTGIPVRPEVVRANLALGGKAGERARLQVGRSADAAVREAVSDRTYGVVVLDGDHSAEGVGEDLRWAEEVAAPGAIIVLDGYGDRRWAGVRQAADAHLSSPNTRLRLLGAIATSAYLRAAR